jgi:hypothetical protein
VADALEADELAVPLAPAIKAAQDEATRLLVSAPPLPPLRRDRQDSQPLSGWTVTSSRTRVPATEALRAIEGVLEQIPADRRAKSYVTWTVEEQD